MVVTVIRRNSDVSGAPWLTGSGRLSDVLLKGMTET